MGSWCPRVVFFSFIPAACYDFCGFCLPKSERKCHQLNLVWLSHNGQVKRSGKKLLTKEIFLQVSRQIHKHVHVCTHQIVSRSTFVSFKALKEAWVNRNSEIPGNARHLSAPACPSRWLSHHQYKCKACYRKCGRRLHFRFLQPQHSHRGCSGPPTHP